MQIVLNENLKPYQGSYELDFAEEWTSRERGWIKRFAGYLPDEYDKAGRDPEFACVLVVIALVRAGRIDKTEASAIYDRLLDVVFDKTVTLVFPDEEPAEEDDAGPPALSSNGSEHISGLGSRTSSETSPATPAASGMPAWAISQSGPPTSES